MEHHYYYYYMRETSPSLETQDCAHETVSTRARKKGPTRRLAVIYRDIASKTLGCFDGPTTKKRSRLQPLLR